MDSNKREKLSMSEITKHDFIVGSIYVFIVMALMHGFEMVSKPRVFRTQHQQYLKSYAGVEELEEDIRDLELRVRQIEQGRIGFQYRSIPSAQIIDGHQANPAGNH